MGLRAILSNEGLDTFSYVIFGITIVVILAFNVKFPVEEGPSSALNKAVDDKLTQSKLFFEFNDKMHTLKQIREIISFMNSSLHNANTSLVHYNHQRDELLALADVVDGLKKEAGHFRNTMDILVELKT